MLRLSEFRQMKLGYWMFLLFVPVAMQRLLKRHNPNPKVNYPKLPCPVNEILYRILSIENRLIMRGCTFPFGTSLYGICTR